MTLATDRIRQKLGAASIAGLMNTGKTEKESSGDFATLLMNLMNQRPTAVDTPSFQVKNTISSIRKHDLFARKTFEDTLKRPVIEPPRQTVTPPSPDTSESEVSESRSSHSHQSDSRTNSSCSCSESDSASEAGMTTKPARKIDQMVPLLVKDLMKSLEDDEQWLSMSASMQPHQVQQCLINLEQALQNLAQEAVQKVREGQSLSSEQQLQILIDILEKSPELSQRGLFSDRESFAPILEQLLQKLCLQPQPNSDDFADKSLFQEFTHEQPEAPQTKEINDQTQVQWPAASTALTESDTVSQVEETTEPQDNDASRLMASEEKPFTDKIAQTAAPRFEVQKESLRQRYESRHETTSEQASTKIGSSSMFSVQPNENGDLSANNTAQLIKEHTYFEAKRTVEEQVCVTEETAVKPAGMRKSLGHQQPENGNQGAQGFSRNLRSDLAPGRTGQTDGLRHTVFNQLIEKAFVQKTTDAVKTLTIQLKPEFLGKVDMELKSKDGIVTARFMAENPLVCETIESLIPQIREHLAEQGITLQQFTVDVYTRQSPNDSSSGRPSDRNFNQSASASRVSSTDEITNEDSGLHEKALTNGNGMIDITV